MKKHTRRGLSFVLVLALLVSLMSGLVINASAGSYTYNWGTRGVTATYLSTAAQNFYSAQGTSYEELAVLTGSSNVNTVPSSQLYGELQDLMAGAHSYITSYEDTKNLYKYTDCQNGGGKISSFYSGIEVGPTWDGSFNREHTWPNSKGLGGNDENDLMMLRPTTTTENSGRGNTAYGRSTGYYDPNKESNGTYNLHGDVARIMLYTYVRWGNDMYMWGTTGVMESKEVLLDWMEEDPVDTWELGRNDAVQSITGTRNVFVDYPELAYVMFGEEIPADMTTPSGKAGATYNITASVNDETMGTVSVSGKNIVAAPAEGYYAADYKVVSGTASVVHNENSFVVSASTDCEIQVIFAPKAQLTVTYLSNGTELATETVYTGDAVTLPAYTGTAPEGYTFEGWSNVHIEHVEELPTILEVGSEYKVNKNTNLYAVFSYTAESSGDVGVWTLVTNASQLSAGVKLVLTSNTKGFVAGDLNGAYLSNKKATFSGDKATITSLPDDAMIFTLGGSADKWTLANDSGKLLGATAVKKLAWGKGTTTWKISVSGGNATIQNATKTYGRFLYNVSAPRFTTYTSDTNVNMLMPQLYMMQSAAESTYYTTSTCAHENKETVAAVEMTCTSDGYTAGVYCNDCQTYLEGHELIAASGHAYESVVTPPTATEDGYTTHTCANCGDSYTDSIVPALGETYVVSFSVPADVAAVADMDCNKTGIILPEAGVPAVGQIEYTFLGWVTAEADHVTDQPAVIYEAGEKYVAESDITLYALYTYSEGSSDAAGAWVLLTDASQLSAGAKLVLASNDKNYVACNLNSAYLTNKTATFSSDKSTITTLPADAVIFTLGGSADKWTLAGADGKLLGATAVKKLAWGKGTTTWKISVSGGDATIQNTTSSYGRFLYNVQAPRFTTYTSATNNNMLMPQLYIQQAATATDYYTTNIDHIHAGVFQKGTESTCTAAGTIDHYVCSCGGYYADEACTKVLESIEAPLAAHVYTAETAEETYLKTVANCHEAAVYYVSCANCGVSSQGTASEATFAYGEVDLSNHDGETKIVRQADASCTDAGYTGDLICLGCENVLEYGEEIPVSDHNFTCEYPGDEYMKASANCHAAAVYYVSCTECGASSQGTEAEATFVYGNVDAENHDGEPQVVGQKDASCTEEGFTGNVYCGSCDALLHSGEVIPMAEHKLVAIDAVDPTHVEDGNIAYYVCDVCEGIFADENGEKAITEEETVLEKLGHTFGDYQYDAEKHWTECSCGEKDAEGAHTFGEWVEVKKADVNKEGLKERACDECGYTETEKIPALSSPATGDKALLALFVMLMVVSVSAMVVLTAKKSKYQR